MTEIPAIYGDPDHIAVARLARVLAALGCETWDDLARLLDIPAPHLGANAESAFPPVPAQDAAVLRNVLRCLPSGLLRAELDRRGGHSGGGSGGWLG